MDRVLWTAVLALLLALLVPLTQSTPVNATAPSGVLSGSDADALSKPGENQTQLVVECKPLAPNPQQLVADCTANQIIPE